MAFDEPQAESADSAKKKKGGPPPQPKIQYRVGCDITPEPMEWIWKDHIAAGRLCVLAGGPNVGKSLLMAGDFAARMTMGTPWPDGSACESGNVLIVTGHDSPESTLVPWLKAHGANMHRVFFVEGVVEQRDAPSQSLLSHERFPKFDDLMTRVQVKLVIFDPLATFLEGSGGPTHEVLNRMQELAHYYGAAFVLITHLRESRPGRSRVGNAALIAAARSVFVLEADPGNPGRRLLSMEKNNFVPGCPGYAWGLTDGRVTWETDRLGVPPAPLDPVRERERREAEAATFIADFLAGGPRGWSVIEEKGKKAGHSAKSLERARSRVAVTFKRRESDGRWLWRLIGDERLSCEAHWNDELFGQQLDGALFNTDDATFVRTSMPSATPTGDAAAGPPMTPVMQAIRDANDEDDDDDDDDLDDEDDDDDLDDEDDEDEDESDEDEEDEDDPEPEVSGPDAPREEVERWLNWASKGVNLSEIAAAMPGGADQGADSPGDDSDEQ